MSPPKELPGFYYDSEKNRYFPIKGPIPGSKKGPILGPCSSSYSSNKEAEVHAIDSRKRLKASKFINLREIQGRDIFSNSKRCFFKDQYQKIQVSHPMVWEYGPIRLDAQSELELVYGTMQSLNGSRDAVFLASGGTGGIILFEMCNFLEDPIAENREVLSKPVWPHLGANGASSWRLNRMTTDIFLQSEISCIKCAPQRTQKHALVTTLGSGANNGLACILNLDWLTRSNSAIDMVANLDSTIWTADFSVDGSHAVLGTNKGATLLNIETKSSRWIYRDKSDVLSQQFVRSGNVVLCGLRNGLIHAIDLRENPRNSRSDRRRISTTRNKNNKEQNSSNSVQMPSAVCSLVSLVSDENYFLGSSMDGSIKLFDLRSLKNGGVQSYEGHVNTHTRLKLAVNPSETLFLSGGQDCRVRVWSIKSGELLLSENVSDSIVSTACWPDLQDRFSLDHSWGAWFGSRSRIFYMHGI